MAKLEGTAEVEMEGSSKPNIAEGISIPTRDGSKEHKSDLTIEKGAPVSHNEVHFKSPYTSKVSRPRSPTSNTPSEEISKKPAININGNSYQFNNNYVANQEINRSQLPTLHQIPRNSNPVPNTEIPNQYSSNGNFQFNNPYQNNRFPAPIQMSNTPFIHVRNNITSYKWENSVPFRPSFNWSKFDFSNQIQNQNNQIQSLYDPLVDSIDSPPINNSNNNDTNNNKCDSESMKISPQISEQEEEAESNNISLPQQIPLIKPNSNNTSNNKNIINDNSKLFYYGSLGVEETNEVSSSNNTLNLKPGQTGQLKLDKKESKELTQFKIALAEYIKELLKPAWQKGILSKEAHKKVVKKSVEKVAGSVKSNQIPDCEESTKSYLSMFKPKIEKLLQDYLEIYGKSEKRDLEMEVNSVV